MDAGRVPGKDPRFSSFARVQHFAQRGCELQERRRRGPAVFRRDVVSALRPGLLRQDGVLSTPRARFCTSMSSGPRSMLKATVNVVASLCVAQQLGLLHTTATVAPPDLMHWEGAARGLVDVHDAVCADCVLVHEPAQLDEQPVRVGVLLHRAVELFHAHGGLLDAEAHVTQELLHPSYGRDGRRVPHRRAIHTSCGTW